MEKSKFSYKGLDYRVSPLSVSVMEQVEKILCQRILKTVLESCLTFADMDLKKEMMAVATDKLLTVNYGGPVCQNYITSTRGLVSLMSIVCERIDGTDFTEELASELVMDVEAQQQFMVAWRVANGKDTSDPQNPVAPVEKAPRKD